MVICDIWPLCSMRTLSSSCLMFEDRVSVKGINSLGDHYRHWMFCHVLGRCVLTHCLWIADNHCKHNQDQELMWLTFCAPWFTFIWVVWPSLECDGVFDLIHWYFSNFTCSLSFFPCEKGKLKIPGWIQIEVIKNIFFLICLSL